MARHGSSMRIVVPLIGLALVLCVSGCVGAVGESGPGDGAPTRAMTPALLEAFGRVPLHFEEHRGAFLARTETGRVWLSRDGLRIDAGASTLRLVFADADGAMRLTPVEPLPGRIHYYRGSDPAAWLRDVPTYRRVRYASVYRGVDVLVYGTQRRLEYDFVLSPGADPARIRVRVEGADALTLRDDGRLEMRRGAEIIVQHPPLVYQDRDGGRDVVAGRYALHGRDEFGFVVGPYDRSRVLVIDPVVAYATRIGGASASNVGGATAGTIAVDSAGFVYITGQSGGVAAGSDYPLVNPAFPHRDNGFTDIFVTKLSPTGDTLIYSTFIGSFGPDWATGGIAVDSDGNAWVAGTAGSVGGVGGAGDFPTTPDAVMPTWQGGSDSQAGVVMKFSPTGSLLYSTYLAGTKTGADSLPGGACIETTIRGIAVDAASNAYVVGWTRTTDFPTTADAYQPSRAGGADGLYCHGDASAFATKLTPAGTLAYSTYLDSADSAEQAWGVAVDGAGQAYVIATSVSGGTTAASFPFPIDATLTASGTPSGSVIVTLDANGVPIHATSTGAQLGAISVGSDASIYVAGTATADVVAVNAVQSAPSGSSDGFAARLGPGGTAYLWSTYLGGSAADTINDIAVAPDGSAWVIGTSQSADFPTMNATRTKRAATEAVVVKVSDVGALLFGTFVGEGTGHGIVVDAAGSAYLTGLAGVDFPTTTGAYRTTPTGSASDAFVVKYVPDAPRGHGRGSGGGQGGGRGHGRSGR